ncbi:MAG TPA: tetratricopeptide repeat protein [Pyrinomonadaceae bacterium]|nr:tetratricopeptide repeat protein [Pyrinomonadaceae bacterium]
MKRCPECRRDYYDDTLLYCLDDGNALLEGPASMDEPATAILSEPGAVATGFHAGEAKTKVFRNTRSNVPTENSNSIAVLPFVNISADEENEHFCDGLAEELLNALSRIEDLKVAARTSAFSFKNKNMNVSEIGQKLDVRNILEGSVRKAGNCLRISVQLVDAAAGFHIWSGRYDREMQDIFDVQDEIALAVVDALKLKLFGNEKAAVLKRGTQNQEAYEFYLKGRYHWNKRTAESIQNAINHFKSATDLDPNYALAFAGLADCYAVLSQYSGAPTSETIPPAKAYAERVIAIDDQLAEPHAALGLVNDQLWQWADSEREYKRAIDLSPNYATAYHWYSLLLRKLGRFEEAASMMKRAHEIEPLSSVININISDIYQIQNDDNASIENSLKLIELDPNFPLAYDYLGRSYLKQGRNAEAIANLEKAVELSARVSNILKDLGYGYGVTGKEAEAILIVKELEERYARKDANGRWVAAVYTGLGDKDKAFEWLEKDFLTRNGDLAYIRWEIPYESLRDDPRFKDLLKRMGLPE